MTSEPIAHALRPMPSMTIAELAVLQRARPVKGVDEFAADLWESDEELDEFLSDLRASRDASLG